MKKRSLFTAIIILIAVCSSFQRIDAQEKEKTKEQKEKEMQEAILEQKKVMVDQQKALEEQKKIQDEVQSDMHLRQEEINKAVEEARQKIDEARKNGTFRVYGDRGARAFAFDEPFVFTAPNVEIFHSFSGDTERTTWDFSKSVKETTFSRDYTFDVEPTVKTVVMAVNGDCKAGDIRIKIMMPNGKTYSDIVIDEFGNLNWRKSFNISETENKDKAGAWKFEISSSKATGYFKISLQTY